MGDIEKYPELILELEQLLRKSWSKQDLEHAHQTLKILLDLNPNANISLKIAAFGHDIDRSLEQDSKQKRDFISKKEYLDAHAENSAAALVRIMRTRGFSEDVISKVQSLVEKHEIGGNDEEQLICDADAITFFQYYAEEYFNSREKNIEKTKKKFLETFSRISLPHHTYLSNIQYSEPILNKLLSELFNKETIC